MRQFCAANETLEFMKIKISPRFKDSEPFVRSLVRSGFFDRNGETLHDGRNTIKSFKVGDREFVVKRYGHLSLLNRLIYGVLRRSKAERAYRHAIRLRGLGIGTPEEVAFVDVRRHGLLSESYFVSVASECRPLRPVTELDTRRPEVQAVLDALAGFLLRMHRSGVLHQDLNIGNILYRNEGCGRYRFEVVDTNRMKFRRRLTVRQSLDNLRRLSCPVPAYLYILDQYARLIRSDATTLQLRGAVLRLFFEMRQRTKRWTKSLLKRKKRVESKQQLIP